MALDPVVSKRAHSMDEDDSLQQLASALTILQRNASDRLGPDSVVETVAEEGQHGLSRRLEDASPASSPLQKSENLQESLGATSSAPEPFLRAEPPPLPTQAPSQNAEQPKSRTRHEQPFRLHVQLDDGKSETIEFAASDDVGAIMREFAERNRLRDLFVDALQERAEQMVKSDRLTASVDIIDLL